MVEERGVEMGDVRGEDRLGRRECRPDDESERAESGVRAPDFSSLFWASRNCEIVTISVSIHVRASPWDSQTMK